MFAGVVEEFERNFTERGEVGASLCVMVDGKPVVDMWGGVADPETGRRWERDTVGVVFSCTKAAVALCIQLLVDVRRDLEDMPVAQVWPAFAVNGKGAITVGMMLNHSAGIPVLSEPIVPHALEDWDYMVGRIAGQAPFWQPGTQHGYHPVTFGHVLGEVVRRVTGSTLGEFFASEIAGPAEHRFLDWSASRDRAAGRPDCLAARKRSRQTLRFSMPRSTSVVRSRISSCSTRGIGLAVV